MVLICYIYGPKVILKRGSLLQLIFSKLVHTSTYPNALFDFRDLIIFSSSLVDVEFN